jgi:hypothetical protein
MEPRYSCIPGLAGRVIAVEYSLMGLKITTRVQREWLIGGGISHTDDVGCPRYPLRHSETAFAAATAASKLHDVLDQRLHRIPGQRPAAQGIACLSKQ